MRMMSGAGTATLEARREALRRGGALATTLGFSSSPQTVAGSVTRSSQVRPSATSPVRIPSTQLRRVIPPMISVLN
eukprot:CAMPEP_0175970362 /NCGR_PEP_ID=MMETSP0108-20121206/41008_1 /TAXON_ID=195067 ORGANISM="Goniomonas pacifica, Strain CCMP1869" /NCGR_SAMPLE_ID=MMETSP0108 /ASSEMBLY_ACC=CAM_ASM_000204 /LENGTH=75 /DNA_ID=CAMNT_0017299313 /DNA_START=103 /DNA_END=327 /DNA_ORIENTATION=-